MMTRIDHYRLDLDTDEGGESFSFDKESAALSALRKHARRKDVTNAHLTGHDAWGDCIEMNEAAREYAWQYYGKGIMLAVVGLREGIKGGYAPLACELAAMCDMLEAKAKSPHTDGARAKIGPLFESEEVKLRVAIQQISRTLPKGYEICIDVDGNYSVESKS